MRTLTKFFVTAIFIHITFAVCAQSADTLKLSEHQSVVLCFKSDIKYVDFGSANIQGEKLSSENMLKLKSKRRGFDDSTISIVTSDGGYHQFNVVYSSLIDKPVWRQDGNSFFQDSIGFSSVKTTHFICDEKITDIVTGSSNIIAGYAEKIDNIVKAKALTPDFETTNIHLITQSGYIYTFNVKPDAAPKRLSVVLSSEDEVTQSSQAIFKNNSVNDNQMRIFAEKLISSKNCLNDIGVVDLKMAFAMCGIYSYSDLLAFRLDIQNNGKIDYYIDFIKGYIRDKSLTKTTAVQEEELHPVFIHYSKDRETFIVKAGETLSVVIFYSRFTIPHKRILYFEMFEKNGGRHLSFPVSDKEILKAKAIY